MIAGCELRVTVLVKVECIERISRLQHKGFKDSSDTGLRVAGSENSGCRLKTVKLLCY